jgi:ubiquinone/menaquinone biosynthesis C-methylase UbiE
MDQHELSVTQFGATAEKYLTSTVHAAGADLEDLAAFARLWPGLDALDVGCGAGHASYALARGGARRVVACDPAAPMLDVVRREAAARGLSAIETLAGPAERLACADAAFDCVVTRYSAHHWSDVPAAVREFARVLRPGGRLIVIDVLAPEAPLLDTVLQTVEFLRDGSHVRDYRESEWRSMFAQAGISEPVAHRWKLPMEFAGWVARIGTRAARIAALEACIDDLPREARDYFKVAADRSLAIDSGWLEGTRTT